MDLLGLFRQFIKAENLFHEGDPLLVAVSGGVDSMVLCELCRQAGFYFSIAHCNFLLRGDESDGEEAFVREWGNRWGVEVIVKRFETAAYAVNNKVSIQVAARVLRYEWFNALLQGDDASGEEAGVKLAGSRTVPKWLLTAHHADDNIETVLMSFFKGTGIGGLRGILPRHGSIVRPLLFARKSRLLDFAQEHQLAYREDSSNASEKYSRNFFRHRLLPVVQQIYPSAEENISRNIPRFREVEQLYRQAIQTHTKNLLEYKANEVHIPVLKLAKSTPLKTIIYEIIKEYGFSANQVEDVSRLLDSESGKYVQSATYRIIKDRRWLIITPKQNGTEQTILVEDKDAVVAFTNGSLQFRRVAANNYRLSADNNTAQLDAGQIRFPLLLRPRKPGDYLYPLGMQKKKKLNRFLGDLRLSKTEKENTWLLEMDKALLWVIGRRIDDRFKVTAKTRQVLEIIFTPNDSKLHPGKL